MISKTGEYALRAVIFMARQAAAQPLRANEIARALDVPANYLSKILHSLVRAGVLSSERGPRGGFRLAKDVTDLSLADVLRPFDPTSDRRTCLLGRPECSDDTACPVHAHWRRVSEPVARFFQETCLADLMVEGTSMLTFAGGDEDAESK